MVTRASDYETSTADFKFLTGLLLIIAACNRRTIDKSSAQRAIDTYLPGAQRIIKGYKAKWPQAEFAKIVAYIRTKDTQNPVFWELMKAFAAPWRKIVKPKAENDHVLSAKMVKLFNSVLAMYAAREYTRLDVLEKTIPPQLVTFGNPHMKDAWKQEVPEQSTDELSYLVKKLTGKKGFVISSEDVTEKMKASPLFKRYKAVRKQVTDAYKVAVRSIVHESGKTWLPIKKVRLALKSEGITIHPLTSEMDSLGITENFLFTNSKGSEIPVSPTEGMMFRFNENYRPDLDDQNVFQYKTAFAKTWQWAFTSARIAKNKGAAFEKVANDASKLPTARTKWRKDMTSKVLWKSGLGAIAELLYTHAGRIGAEGNENDGKPTYGLSTLLVKHVKAVRGGYKIVYDGKKGTEQEHVVKDPELCAAIERALKNKKPSDRLFTDSNKNPIQSGDVNRYLKKDLGLKMTAHKFRHARSTVIFNEEDKKHPLSKTATQKQAETHFKKLVVEVGRALGHKTGKANEPTANVSIKSYLDPALARSWFTRNNKRVPAFVPRAGSESGDE